MFTGNKSGWLIIILLLVLVISGLHYSTNVHHGPMHALYRKLYYLPILISAFHFGLKGALACAITCVILYIPHLHFDHGADYLVKNADRTLEVILYLVVALITGTYSTSQKNLVDRLKQSNDQLKQQAENLVRIQATLLKQEKLHAIGLLGAGISHEIKNPLSSLRGLLEIIFDDQEIIREEKEELCEIAKQEIKRIQDILSRFLSLGREENNESESVDLKGVCQDILELTRSRSRERRLNPCFSTNLDQPIIQGFSGPIRQVLLNLVLNAIEMAQSFFEIRLEKVNDRYLLRILDDGPGVPEGSEEVIFDFFYTTRQDGTGLGLPISTELMRLYGGHLELESISNPTCFLITIPEVMQHQSGGKHQVAFNSESEITNASHHGGPIENSSH